MTREVKADEAALLAGWVLGAGHRHPPEFWETPVGKKVALSVRLAATQLPRAELPAGLAPGAPTPKGIRQSGVRIYGGMAGLQIDPASAPISPPLFQFETGPVYHKHDDRIARLAPGDRIQSENRIEIHSAQENVLFQKKFKPPWATAIEQGPEGLYCTLPDDRRLRWCYPGEAFRGALHPLSAVEGVRAAWVDESQWADFESGKPPYLPEGVAVAAVRYGRAVKLSVKGESLRLRWIPPGDFWMGSPDDEPQRLDNETRHRVLLTRGYWLAETACSQALWRAVMGDNPSEFKGEDLPVETVSWDEVHTFYETLNRQLPGLQARLPSEAEWEYACRAGTATPFWWGGDLSTDLANYDGNYPYHNGPKGKYRDKTMPVKSFASNPWGLYQMHGNAWEWCEDGFADYPSVETSIDPTGPERGSDRVGRGGGWIAFGRWLRAAYRYDASPALRSPNLGFRLAAGPRPGGAQQ